MGLCRMGPPVDLMLELAAAFSIADFVETGTYEGNTANWAADHFQKVSTIEFSETFYRAASEKYRRRGNIEFIFGDSRTRLEKIVADLNAPALFWLDAHWSGGATYGNDDQCPLIEELKIISRSKFDDFVFIDDARLFTSPPPPPHAPEQWSDIASIIAAIRAARGDKYIVIIEDAIIAVPARAKKIVADYCQNVNAKIWEDYSARQNKNESDFKKGIKLTAGDLLSRMKIFARKIYRPTGKNR